MAGIAKQWRIFPPSLRQSSTSDPGTEFAAFLNLREKLGMASYFCMPSAPRQKGRVENNNGRIRRFLPLDTDIALVSDKELQALVDKINHTPRKCIDYRTQYEGTGEAEEQRVGKGWGRKWR